MPLVVSLAALTVLRDALDQWLNRAIRRPLKKSEHGSSARRGRSLPAALLIFGPVLYNH